MTFLYWFNDGSKLPYLTHKIKIVVGIININQMPPTGCQTLVTRCQLRAPLQQLSSRWTSAPSPPRALAEHLHRMPRTRTTLGEFLLIYNFVILRCFHWFVYFVDIKIQKLKTSSNLISSFCKVDWEYQSSVILQKPREIANKSLHRYRKVNTISLIIKPFRRWCLN